MAVVRLSYSPAEVGAVVAAVRLYTDPARTGTPFFTGVPVVTSGVWTFSPDLPDGDYFSSFDVTDSTGSFTDSDDWFYVHQGQVGRTLVGLAEVKAYMGLTKNTHDGELRRYCRASLGVVEEMAGPTLLRRSFTERVAGARRLLLGRYPVVSVTSVGIVGHDGTVTLTTVPAYVEDANYIVSPVGSGTAEVTYVAGLAEVPDEAVDAALVYVSYKYRRNHGGSESYMPAGVDGQTLPPMGTHALEQQMRLALGSYARGARVS